MSFACGVDGTLPCLDGASCGMIVLQNNYNSLRIELRQREGQMVLCCVKAWYDADIKANREEMLSEQPVDSPAGRFYILADRQNFSLCWNGKEQARANGAFMGSETAGGFIGAYIGVFASGNGANLPACAAFAGFSLK